MNRTFLGITFNIGPICFQGMSANEVEFLGIEYAARLTNNMGGNSDEVASLSEKHWLGKKN